MKKLPNHTALKEWSNVIEALGSGTQVILIRKGGIADPKFGVEAEQFYLYPTYFHQGESEARPSAVISHWAEVVRTWEVRDLELLYRAAAHVAIPRETIDARYRFRPDQALHVIGVRVFELARPVEVAYREDYGGCRSWISIEDEIDIESSRAVLDASALEKKLGEIESALSPLALGLSPS